MAEQPYDPREDPLRGAATAPGMSLGFQPYNPAKDPLRPQSIPAPPGPPPTPQMEGWYRSPAMAGSYLAKGALEGTGMLGDVQDFLRGQINQRIVDPVRYALGYTDPVTPPADAYGRPQFYPGAAGQPLEELFPGATPEQLPDYLQANREAMGPTPFKGSPISSRNLVSLGQEIGAVDNPALKPQNAPERYLAATAEGVGGALPTLAFGGGIPAAARAVVQGAAAGAGGELASEYSDSPWARVGGSVAGALGAGGVLTGTGKAFNAARGESGPLIAAYDRLGIPVNTAADSTIMQQLQGYSAKSPGGAGRMQKVGAETLGAFDNAVENTAGRLGRARTADQAGDALAMNERAWVDRFAKNQQRDWNEVDMYLPKTDPAPATNYTATLNRVAQDIPTYTETAKTLQQPLTRQLLDNLIKDSQKGPPTVADLRGIRTRIGERLGEPVIAGDTSRVELQRLWGALSQDIESLIATKGPQAQAAFAKASATSREGHQFIETVLNKISQGTPAQPTGLLPGQAAERALSTGGVSGSFLQRIRDEMPGAADALAAYKLRDMSLAAPQGARNPTGATYSPSRFMTETHPKTGLTQEAYDALFGANPDVAGRLSDMGTVAGHLGATERFVNFSGTNPSQQISSIFQKADYGVLPANWAISRAATSPWVNRVVAAPSPLPASPGSRLGVGGALYPQLRGVLAP